MQHAFRYRGTDSLGKRVAGQIDAGSREEAVRRLRQAAILPIDVTPGAGPAAPSGALTRTGKTRTAITRAIGELAVLLEAGIPLERAMALLLDSIEQAPLRAEFAAMQQAVKEGAPLSRTLSERPALFPPVTAAMAEAGEADGRLGPALSRLAQQPFVSAKCHLRKQENLMLLHLGRSAGLGRTRLLHPWGASQSLRGGVSRAPAFPVARCQIGTQVGLV